MVRKPTAITLPFTNIDIRKRVCVCAVWMCVYLRYKTFGKQSQTLVIYQSTCLVYLKSQFRFLSLVKLHVLGKLSHLYPVSSVCVCSQQG